MFFKKTNENLRSLFTIFAVLALAATVLWLGANSSAASVKSAKSGDNTNQPAITVTGTGVGAIPDPDTIGIYGAPLVISFPVSGVTNNVSNVSVSMTINHTWIGDLDAVLAAPGGSPSIQLFSRVGATTDTSNGDSSNLSGTYIFTDAATGANLWTVATDAACTTDCVVAPGSYRTTAPGGAGAVNPPAYTSLNATFSSLTAAQANGTWTLTIRDRANGDQGSVTAASLSINEGTGGTVRGTLHDFTGNGRTDWTTIANYDPQFTVTPAGTPLRWKITGNPAPSGPNAAFIRAFDYGVNGDTVVPEDYVGDRKTEVAVWRSGIYYLAQFPTGTGGITLDRAVSWGVSSDFAGVEGDYDGDGKVDYAVVRRDSATGNLTWYIQSSSTGLTKAINFGTTAGATGATVFPGADFNGDGRDELIFVTRNAAGAVTYYIGDANTGLDLITRQWGNWNSDYSVAPRDYTGDGKADFVAVRETSGGEVWYINNSATNTSTATTFGIGDPSFTNGDLPVRGDFDGDGIQDICVWRPSNQTFYYISSQNGSLNGQKAGDPGDFPLGTIATY